MSVPAALARVRDDIARLEADYGRAPGSVALLAVGKTKPVDDLAAAIQAGQRRFGENYVDEALGKIATLGHTAPDGSALEWHFIGAIQSRKCSDIADHFDWAHGVDRMKTATRLSQRIVDNGRSPLSVCVQVNSDEEASKAGVALDELDALADEVAALPGLVLRGLMAIPAPRESLAEQRAVFATLHERFAELARRHASIDTLSCGMSGDLEAAIAEGATMVRIGTAVFGAR